MHNDIHDIASEDTEAETLTTAINRCIHIRKLQGF